VSAFRVTRIACAAALSASFAAPAMSQTDNASKPTWWANYEYLVANGADTCTGAASVKVVRTSMCRTNAARRAKPTSP